MKEKLKECGMCEEVKLVELFSSDKRNKNGIGYECKKCSYARVIKWRQKTGFYHSEQYRRFRRKVMKNSIFGTYTYRKDGIKKYYDNNTDAIKARMAVYRAKKNGTLVEKPCEVCGEKKVHAHHFKGYLKENYLIVKWLCNEHHRITHLEEKYHG